MSRALLNHETVVRFIKENFVAVSGAVEILQPDRYGAASSAASKWFEPCARRALKSFAPPKFWDEFKTYQGMYVLDSDGTVLEYKVGLPYDPEDFKSVLQKALIQFRKTHPQVARARREATAVQAVTHSRDVVGPSVSVLQCYSRILPLPVNATISERSVGRDFMWVYRDDCVNVLETASERGKTVPMPKRLVGRLVRFQLLNHVGNIMHPFDENDVKTAEFTVRRLADHDNLRVFEFHGSFKSDAPPNKEHGAQKLEGTIYGDFSIDPSTRKIVRFRGYGEGTSKGGNDSLSKERTYPVVFAIIEATLPQAHAVVPFWAAIPAITATYENPKLKSASLQSSARN